MAARDIFLDFVGFLFLLLFIAQTGLLVLSQEYAYILWFSNHATLIMGIAILYRSSIWLTAEAAIGLVPEGVWIADFGYHAITGKFLTGATAYIAQLPPLHYAIALQHLVVIPLAIACLWIIKTNKKSIFPAFIHSIVLWLTGYVVNPELNINCSHNTCIPFLEHPAYALFWPVLALQVIFVSYWILLLMCQKVIIYHTEDNPQA